VDTGSHEENASNKEIERKGSTDAVQRQTADRTGRSVAEVIAARSVPATPLGDAWSSGVLPRAF
jgi:hypothetical protein